MLTQEYLKECLNYNPETGVITWKERPEKHFKTVSAFKMWNTRYCGKSAGSVNGKGYIHMPINGKSFSAHRLAWMYVYGQLPSKHIDHIDENKLNNKISNLRDTSREVNQQNISQPRINNKTGFRGVYKRKNGKYTASISFDSKNKWIGDFDTPQQAHAAYLEAKKIHHKGYIHD